MVVSSGHGSRSFRGQRPERAASAPVSADLLSQELRLVVSGAGPDLAQAGLTAKLDALAARAALAEQPGLARSARNASAAMSAQDGSAAADAMAQLAAAASPARRGQRIGRAGWP